MTRRPAHASPRQAIWEELRRQSEGVTARAISDRARIPVRTVNDYLASLVRSGHLAESGHDGDVRLDRIYVLVRDVGNEAPRVRRDGSGVTAGGGTEAMWRTMQMLGEFSADDIAHHATTDRSSVSTATASSYVLSLAKAGYLRVVRPASNAGGRAVYRLIRRSGPRPPQIQRVQRVYDPNTGEVFGAAETEELA